jgi:hypothetical protein
MWVQVKVRSMQKDLRPAVSTSYSQHIFAYLDIPAGASFFGRAIDVPPRCTLDAARHPVYFGTHVTMNIKKLPSVTVALALLPVAARGQATGSTTQTSSWGNLFWSLIPIIFVVLIFIPLIRRVQKPIMKRSQQHMERQVQHMERVEQSLERIIKALERKD